MLDNHGAHDDELKFILTDYGESNIHFLKTPAGVCVFNQIETIWSLIKNQFQRIIYEGRGSD